ncbi:MAG: 3-phosphoshikimate 1-carboxyvinyltransferase [Planctomycetota bacterium]
MPRPAPADARTLARPLVDIPDPLALPGPATVGSRTLTMRPPGSKSLTNRTLLLAALAEGASTLTGALTDADDAQRMLGALAQLGVRTEHEHDHDRVTVHGMGGRFATEGAEPTLFLNNAGTATRFLTGAAILADGPVVVDGNARMRERPIGELVTLLRTLGARVDELGEAGFVPVRVHPIEQASSTLRVATTLSSQYVSALLQVGPWLPEGIEIVYTDPATSPSYVRMTAGLLERLGAEVEVDGPDRLLRVRVGHGPLRAFQLDVEPDASGATYLWGAAALVEGLTVETPRLGTRSLQGDSAFPDVVARMGARVERTEDTTRVTGAATLRGIDADLSDMPDAAMTLGALAACADGPTTIRGLRTLRVKETDRIEAMRTELARVGASVRVFEHAGSLGEPDEGVTIIPGDLGTDHVSFDTYDDHRMAMSSALLALRRPHVTINDPGCVNKTYATFWADFARLAGLA